MTDAAPFRFSLRSVFTVVLIVSIGCTFIPAWLRDFPFSVASCVAFVLIAIIMGVCAFLAGARITRLPQMILRISAARLFAGFAFTLSAIVLIYLSLVFLRELDQWALSQDPLYPRSFPYADRILERYEAWLDARNPAPPGTIKFHGEYYTLLKHLTMSLLISCTVLLFWLGLLAPNLANRIQLQTRRLLRRSGSRAEN